MTSNTQLGTQADRAIALSRCTLEVLSGEHRGTETTLSRDVVRIGKSNENDLVLSDGTVSRLHCELVRERTGWLVRDLGSTNGTRLDGTPVKEAWLSPGAVLSVGKVEIRVRAREERIEIPPSEKTHFGDVVGRSLAMRRVFGMLERLARADVSILLGGETGTGKDLVARAIHAASDRSKRPFVVVDCGAVVSTLIESELFGHERGAFTGAAGQRKGALELAHGGTLFLDEIGELPLDLQPKLLRALETRTFKRVGGSAEVSVDIRVIAATKRNLLAEVERGKFREDLYFRLAVAPIVMPPLRERREDIPFLIDGLLASTTSPGQEKLGVSERVIAALASHEWPGNVRELRNVLERASYLARAGGDHEISAAHLPFSAAREAPKREEAFVFSADKSYRDTRTAYEDRFERAYVTWLLAKHGGNVSAAARAADMDRKYLHKLARKHGIGGSED